MTLAQIPFTTLIAAFAGGVLPTLIWLQFWLREDNKENPEPPFLLVLTFIGGMLVVPLIVPLENFVYFSVLDNTLALTINAFIEEFAKLAIVALIAFGTPHVDEPNNYAIYLITAALGFAGLENTLYLLESLSGQDVALAFFTGNLRFLGSTVLHVVSSGILGVIIGLSFYHGRTSKIIHAILGLVVATTLHGLFNFFIIGASTQEIITVFGVTWVAAIILLFLFEKLNQMRINHDRLHY